MGLRKTLVRAAIGLTVAIWWAFTLACGSIAPNDQVNVNCEGMGTHYECTVAHTQGENDCDACWTVTMTCNNGTVGTANACQRVTAGGTATRSIPIEQFSGLEECDSFGSLELIMDTVTPAN